MLKQLIEQTKIAVEDFLLENRSHNFTLLKRDQELDKATLQYSEKIAHIYGVIAKYQKKQPENAEGFYEELMSFSDRMNGLFYRIFPGRDKCRLRALINLNVKMFYERAKLAPVITPELNIVYAQLKEIQDNMRQSHISEIENRQRIQLMQEKITRLEQTTSELNEKDQSSQERLKRYEAQLDTSQQLLGEISIELEEYKQKNAALDIQVKELSKQLAEKSAELTTLCTQYNIHQENMGILRQELQSQARHIHELIRLCHANHIDVPAHILSASRFLLEEVETLPVIQRSEPIRIPVAPDSSFACARLGLLQSAGSDSMTPAGISLPTLVSSTHALSPG